MDSHGKEVKEGKKLVLEQTQELLLKTASPVQPDSGDTETRWGSNAETDPHPVLVYLAKVDTCGDRHISEAHRKEREQPVLGVRL